MPFEKKDAAPAPHAGDWTTITKHLSLRMMNIVSCRAKLQEEILEEYFEEDKGRIKPKIRWQIKDNCNLFVISRQIRSFFSSSQL